MIVGLSVIADSTAQILRALDHRLSPRDNWQCKLVGPITTPGGADTEFTVTHNLGIVPIAYIANVDKNAVVYDSRRASWTTSVIYLKCTATSATIYLIVL